MTSALRLPPGTCLNKITYFPNFLNIVSIRPPIKQLLHVVMSKKTLKLQSIFITVMFVKIENLVSCTPTYFRC